MRFLIQNYNLLNKSLVLTPRLRFGCLLNYLLFFFIFQKNYFFAIYFKFGTPHLSKSLFFLFYKYFYFKQFRILIKKLNLELVGFYTNNLIKSLIVNIYLILAAWIGSNLTQPLLFLFFKFNFFKKTKLIFNLFFFSIKTSPIRLNKTFFKNFFFYLLFFHTTVWYQHANHLNYYLNFFLINSNLFLTPFYHGYFFHIFNF